MRAADIGPAIIGLSKMISQTTRILYGDETKVTVEVEADFERASFGMEFFAVSQAADMLPSLNFDQLLAIARTLGIIGSGVAGVSGGVMGVIKLLKWLKGRHPARVEVHDNQATITNIHDESVTITINELRAASDPDIRRGLESLVGPMESEGVEAVELNVAELPPERISRDERDSFTAPVLLGEAVGKHVSEAILEVVAPTFREQNKWRFAQGEASFYAEMLDEHFLERVARHEVVFGKGDALRVEMEVETTRVEGELKFVRRILRVIEHLPAPQSNQLSFES
jgi:hypothetical protein